MQIAFLLLTDYSESLNGKLYTLGAGWNVLNFPELPQEWRFSVGMGIDVPWDETNRRHSIQLVIQDPDGYELGDELSMEVEAGRPPGLPPGQEQRLVIAINVGATFETSGPHAIVVRDGDEELERARFYLAQVSDDALQFGGPDVVRGS
ncbi:MAG TPA: hypothetical protein VKA41_02395 [Solirubrobacterales bacterium]|nr:hypothetical protein [Solirubrobacterales bacterium]